MWKNKHAGVSAKRKGKKGKKGQGGKGEVEEWSEGKKYVRNDGAVWAGRVWRCRRGHVSGEGLAPKGEGRGAELWREEGDVEGEDAHERDDRDGDGDSNSHGDGDGDGDD